MSGIFRVKLLPALHGDCIWIEYGEPDAPRRVLIDGGPVGAYPALVREIEKLPADQRTFELLVVTHIDADHIDGIVKLLVHAELGVKYREVWFNGWPQLKRLPTLAAATATEDEGKRGALSGSYLDHLLVRGGEANNARFDGRAVCIADAGPLPVVHLDGGLDLTLLSPTVDKLRDLRANWEQAFRKMGGNPDDRALVAAKLAQDRRFRGEEGAALAVPSGFDEAAALALELDAAVANGSSIAFVAEYAGRRCALLGDAHAPLVEKSFRRLARGRNEPRLELTALKLSHHGSKGNTTPGLMNAIDCRTYAVSTNGSVFHHPDDQALRCVVHYAKPARLLFNYRSERTAGWSNTGPDIDPDYASRYPEHDGDCLVLDLLAAEPTAAP
jgi:hypothetical protein